MNGLTVLPILLVFSVLVMSGCTTSNEITSFDECIAAGYPAMESYPRQCMIANGETFTEVINETIGGERDEHGCLGPAGYTWNETLGTCVREWELSNRERSAVKIAADYLDRPELTVVAVLDASRTGEGHFTVQFEEGEEREVVDILLSNWTVSFDSGLRHMCTAEEKAAQICTMEYVPVCGRDEFGNAKTYGNGCSACSAGVEYWDPGECES
jgi:hypothetical protein